MSFSLTPEQRSFREVLHAFVDERVAPFAAEHDRDQTFPQESFDACVEIELPSLGVPEAYGGAGADLVTQAIMIEELARGCASTSVTILISKLGMLPIMNFASEEIKHAYLPRVAAGEIQASYCLSETDAGSDVASMSCRAERDGDDYVLERLEVLDHQLGRLGRLHRLRQDRPGRWRPRHHLFPRREGLGTRVPQARGQDGAARLADGRGRPARRSRAGGATESATRVRASRSPCTRSTVRGRRSAPRPWASPRARSTTPRST